MIQLEARNRSDGYWILYSGHYAIGRCVEMGEFGSLQEGIEKLQERIEWWLTNVELGN